MKKLSAFFVALICASAIFAADYNCEIRGICYGLDTTDMTAEVIKRSNYYLNTRLELDLYSGSIVIPSKITYKRHTYSVTTIGERAFDGCYDLKSVKIPTSVTTIGERAFSECSGLKSVTIPNSVTTIGDDAFYNVNNIVYDGTATGSPWGAKCINGYRRGNFIYSDASKTTLCGCSSTAKGKMIIPNSVTTIGDGAFSVCSDLQSVTIPNSVTTIGKWAFSGCRGLKSVTIPNSVTTIGEEAFFFCDSLTSINVDTANTHYCSIDGVLFSYAKDTLIQYPKGNTQTEYTIPSSVTTIGKEAFFSCDSLKSVTIPNSVTTIGNWAFYGCRGLQSVTIPNSVTTIGDNAFAWCRGLKSVSIPNSVTTIGEKAFSHCFGLKSITCYAIIPPKCGLNAFDNVGRALDIFFINSSSTKVYVPASAVEDYQNADGWEDLQILPITGEVKNSH